MADYAENIYMCSDGPYHIPIAITSTRSESKMPEDRMCAMHVTHAHRKFDSSLCDNDHS